MVAPPELVEWRTTHENAAAKLKRSAAEIHVPKD